MGVKYRRPVKRSPKSDPQQYRVYRMEVEAIGARRYMRLTRPVIRQLVASISRNYHIPQPGLVWENLGRWAAEWRPDGSIAFNTHKGNARDFLTVTHEMAHHLHFHLAGDRNETQEGHGPEFMACHMSILDTCRMIPVVAMRAICDDYKIRYKDPGTTNSLVKLQSVVRN